MKKLFTLFTLLTALLFTSLPAGAENWYLIGGQFGNNWNASYKNYPMTEVLAPDGSSTGIFYRYVEDLWNANYFRVHDGTNQYGPPSTSSDYDFTSVGQTFSLLKQSSTAFKVSVNNSNVGYALIVVDSKSKKIGIFRQSSWGTYALAGGFPDANWSNKSMTSSTNGWYQVTVNGVSGTPEFVVRKPGDDNSKMGTNGTNVSIGTAYTMLSGANNAKMANIASTKNLVYAYHPASATLLVTEAPAAPAPSVSASPNPATAIDGSQASVTLTPSNATSWWYQVADQAKQSFSNGNAQTFTIGDASATANQSITINWGATNADNVEATGSFTYTLKYIAPQDYNFYLQGVNGQWSDQDAYKFAFDGTDTYTLVVPNSVLSQCGNVKIHGGNDTSHKYWGPEGSSEPVNISKGNTTIKYTGTKNFNINFSDVAAGGNVTLSFTYTGSESETTLNVDYPQAAPVASVASDPAAGTFTNASTKQITLTPSNATSWWYQVTGQEKQSFSNGNAQTFTIGVASAEDDQTITVSWGATNADNVETTGSFTYTLKAPSVDPLYMAGGFQNWNPSNATEMNFNKQTRNYYLVIQVGTDKKIKLSTVKAGWSSGFNSHAKTLNGSLVDGSWVNLKSGDANIELPVANAKYTIYVKEDLSQIKVEQAFDVNMPLTRSDFENGKVHYFLVGSRMGDWHLQPEWELVRQSDGTYALKDKIMYPTLCGIAKVSSYADYVNQRFEFFAQNNNGQYVFHNGHKANDNFLESKGTKQAYFDYNYMYNHADDANNNPFIFNYKNSLYFNDTQSWLLGDDNTTENRSRIIDNSRMNHGIFVKSVVVNMNAGNPQGITFDFDDNNDANKAARAKERIFTLVGSKIINADNAATGKKAPLEYGAFWNQNGGWEEAWIQYDGEGKPYYDARGTFIYQTDFQKSWFEKHPSYFYDNNIRFTSDNLTFVKSDELENLESDPYRFYYASRSGSDKTIGDHNPWSGTNYNFVEVLNGHTTTTITPDANGWDCYVLRDVYVDDEFKVWSGFGGGSQLTEAFERYNPASDPRLKDPRWNALNGGPAAAADGEGNTFNVSAFDITNGSNATLYKMTQTEGGFNFKVDNRTYFKRIIVWYNQDFNYSVIQFIKEEAAPEIVAFDNDNTQWIDYEWSINYDDASKDVELKSYQIKRYRVTTTGTRIDQEFDKVTLTEGTTIDNLAQSLTRVTDKGVNNAGIRPGTYFYEVTLTAADGREKTGVSNHITLYDAEKTNYNPELVLVQLVELTDAGRTRMDQVDNTSIDLSGYQYVTYRSHDNANYYAIKVADDGKVTVKDIDNAKAKALFTNPAYYYWTSKYYVAVLDNKAFNKKMNDLKENAEIESFTAPQFNITMSSEQVAERTDVSSLVALTQPGSDVDYYGFYIDRHGLLDKSDFELTMTYNVNGSDNKSMAARAEIVPVVAKPYNLVAQYADPKHGITVPGDLILSTVSSHKTDSEGNPVPLTVTVSAQDLKIRELCCNFTFNRPNVSTQILAHYDIVYTVHIFNDNDAVDLDHLHRVADERTDLAQGEMTYTFTVNDINPTEAVNPVCEIVKTEYIANEGVSGAYEDTQLDAIYGFDELKVSAPNQVVKTRASEFNEIKIGVENCSDYGWCWMYYGHDLMTQPTDDVDHGDSTTDSEMEAKYYHVESYVVNDQGIEEWYAAEKLISTASHDEGWFGGAYDGVWVGRNFTTHARPTFVFTPVYIFQRRPNISVDDDENLEIYDPEPSMAPGDAPVEYVVLRSPDVVEIDNNSDVSLTLTGLEDIAVEDCDAEYYTLQGYRVEKPVKGQVYIVRCGGTVSKVLVK